MIPKEFKIVAFYDETQDHRLVSGTRGDCEAAGRLMRREAARIQFDRAAEKVGNVDGSPWIRNQVERQSLPLDDLGLDFYHLGENVPNTTPLRCSSSCGFRIYGTSLVLAQTRLHPIGLTQIPEGQGIPECNITQSC